MSSYSLLFTTFFKIGAFTLGGGYAMLPIIEEDVVDKYHWIKKEEFIDYVAVAQSCPGVFAINLATFVGYKLKGKKGALCTTLGSALPSFLIHHGVALGRGDVPRHTSRRGGAHCRTDIHTGQECPYHPVQLLDSHCLGTAHLGTPCQPYLDYHRHGTGRLCLR